MVRLGSPPMRSRDPEPVAAAATRPRRWGRAEVVPRLTAHASRAQSAGDGGGVRGRRGDPRAALRPPRGGSLSAAARSQRIGRPTPLSLQATRPAHPRSPPARRRGARRPPRDPQCRRRYQQVRPRASGGDRQRPGGRGRSRPRPARGSGRLPGEAAPLPRAGRTDRAHPRPPRRTSRGPMQDRRACDRPSNAGGAGRGATRRVGCKGVRAAARAGRGSAPGLHQGGAPSRRVGLPLAGQEAALWHTPGRGEQSRAPRKDQPSRRGSSSSTMPVTSGAFSTIAQPSFRSITVSTSGTS